MAAEGESFHDETDRGPARDVELAIKKDTSIGGHERKKYMHSHLVESFFVSECMHKGLVWNGVNMKLLGKKGKTKLDILEDVWGVAEAGKTTAIMGASGAGKTSLFQTLAGRVSTRGKIAVEGNVYLGGVEIDPSNQEHRRLFAYVSQEESLDESSTPREALAFSARLRLPKNVSDKEIKGIVNACLEELGLESVADNVIGGGLKKGLSGGERRRVSIGVELVASPSIIFLDEPTSGLDSYAAAQVMMLLERVAKAGNTVLFTIHQPSSSLFSMFDRLILLNKGRVMHQGDVSKVGEEFSRLGFPVPANYNPADWAIDLAQTKSIEELERSGFFSGEPADHLSEINPDGKLSFPERNHVSMWREFVMLQRREMRSLQRNPLSIIINVCLTGILSLIFGVIFFDIGRQDRSNYSVIQSQVGALVNLLICTLMGQSNTALLTFSKDRPVFLREYSTGHYSIIPYFLSKLWSEAINSLAAMLAQTIVVYWLMGFQMSFWQLLVVNYTLALTATAVVVMIGAFVTEPDHINSFYTLAVVPQFYFSGLFIAIELMPDWVSWAQYLCSMTYASRISFAYEFGSCEPGATEANCQAVLNANNVSVDDTWWYWLALLGLFSLFRLGGVLLLKSKARY